MSSLKHAVHRRVHLEREQPANRSHLGLLEKHKDYVERARRCHQWEQELAALEEKAKAGNPLEFNYRMVSGNASVDTQTGYIQLRSKKRKLVGHLQSLDLDAAILSYSRSIAVKKLSKTLDCASLVHKSKINGCNHKLFFDDSSDNEISNNDVNLDERKLLNNLLTNIASNNTDSGMEKTGGKLSSTTKGVHGNVNSSAPKKKGKVLLKEIRKQEDYCRNLTALIENVRTQKALLRNRKAKKISESKIGNILVTSYKWFGRRQK